METSQNSTESASKQLGALIREGRSSKGLTIVALAELIDRPREWLNRIELGYSEFGELKPPNASTLKHLANCLEIDAAPLLELGARAEAEYASLFRNQRSSKARIGKVIQDEVIIGDAQIYSAAERIINEQHSDAIIRTTGIWSHPSTELAKQPEWKSYKAALGKFLNSNRSSSIKRAEYLGTQKNFDIAIAADKALSRSEGANHNIKIKFFKYNPVIFDVLIGQREAIIGFPHSTGYTGAAIGLVVRDKLFVEALRTWFDEVVWESGFENKKLDFDNLPQSLAEIREMYKYTNKEE